MPDETPDWVKAAEARIRSGERGRPEVYPLSTMEVATLHVVPREEVRRPYPKLAKYVNERGHKLGRKFATRVNPDTGAFEIWRSL